MEKFKTTTDQIIALPDVPYQLRFNKKCGLIGTGPLETDEEKLTHSKGKWIEGCIVNVVSGLHGSFGQGEPCDWVFISFLVTKSEALYPGMLVHFYSSKVEASKFNMAKTELELKAIFEEEVKPTIWRIEFAQASKTQHGTFYYPEITNRNADNVEEAAYFEAVQTILSDYSHKLPDPTTLDSVEYDEKGEFVRGIMAIESSQPQEQKVLTASVE